MCFLIQKHLFMKRFCNTCAETMIELYLVLGFIAIKMILNKGM